MFHRKHWSTMALPLSSSPETFHCPDMTAQESGRSLKEVNGNNAASVAQITVLPSSDGNGHQH